MKNSRQLFLVERRWGYFSEKSGVAEKNQIAGSITKKKIADNTSPILKSPNCKP